MVIQLIDASKIQDWYPGRRLKIISNTTVNPKIIIRNFTVTYNADKGVLSYGNIREKRVIIR